MNLNREKRPKRQTYLKRTFKSKDLLETLPHRTQDSLLKTTEDQAQEFYTKVRKKGLKRRKYLIQK